MGFRLFFWS